MAPAGVVTAVVVKVGKVVKVTEKRGKVSE